MNAFTKFLLAALCAVATCASANDQYIRAYLQQVYPTSPEINRLSDVELRDYYALELNTWYKTPLAGYESGLLDQRIEPQYKVFVFPDTAARARTDLDNIQKKAKEGFTTVRPVLGSNKDYIEVSSLAWMEFPFGAYYNWAHGSGIYLYTGGKSIVGYTKVDVLYNIYAKRKVLDEYFKRLGDTKMVHRQIFGTDRSVSDALNLYVQTADAQKYEAQAETKAFTEQHFYVSALPLAAVLLNDRNWRSNEFVRIKKLVQRKNYDGAYRILLEKYVEDHRLGNFDQALERYKYLGGEAKPDIDEWMYDAAKADGYTMVQMTYEPNSMGQPTFELCDVRWPKLGGIPNIDVDAIDKGYQNYSISYVWKKVQPWLSKRNPFDLANEKQAIPVSIVMPDLNQTPNPEVIFPPPRDFPRDWLPTNGWSLAAAEGDYYRSDSFIEWIQLRPAPEGLLLPNGEGRFVSWALDNANDFSFIDFKHNAKLLKRVVEEALRN